MSSILTDNAGVVVASALQGRAFWLGVGSGVAAWGDAPPAPSVTTTALENELGRLRARNTAMVMPDATGAISLPDLSRWSISATPTKYLYVNFVLEFNEIPTETLREAAIFIDTTAKADVPAGRNFVAAADIADAGEIFTIERFAPLARNGAIRHEFPYVINI